MLPLNHQIKVLSIIIIINHIYTGYLQLYTLNKPCL